MKKIRDLSWLWMRDQMEKLVFKISQLLLFAFFQFAAHFIKNDIPCRRRKKKRTVFM